MLNINDDMDDLIRQAASQYPLKTDGSDWDKVLGGIQADAEAQPVKSKKTRWLLLLLLLPLIIAIPLLDTNKKMQESAVNSNSTQTTKNKPINATGISANNVIQPAGILGNTPAPANTANNQQGENKLTAGNSLNTTAVAVPGKSKEVADNNVLKKKKRANFKRNYAGNINSQVTAADAASNNIFSQKNSRFYNNKAITNQPDSTVKTIETTGKKSDEEKVTPAQLVTTNSISSTIDSVHQKDSAAAATKKSSTHVLLVKKTGLYAGAAASLDATTIKYHKISKTGYSLSLVVGYRINNNWSLETGLAWDNKNYFSPGRYFDKSRTGIPTDSYIHFLNGSCRMYEVPLNVKYDFTGRKLSGFYISAGISSYFMKKENYEYHATNNGNYYIGKHEYKNSTNNIFSVVNINGGYQFIFKNNNSLRIEPYMKVPLNGLGIGKLPFTSAGLSAAYTLPLH